MITITNIRPRYEITKDNERIILQLDVEFTYRKKIARTQTSVELSGCLTFPHNEVTIDLNNINQKIAEIIFNQKD